MLEKTKEVPQHADATYMLILWLSKVLMTSLFLSDIRQLALYSTGDWPSYVLELCPTRKKSSHLSFFFLRHAGFTSLDLTFFPLKMAIFTENLLIFPFLFNSWPRSFIFIFFLRHGRKTPVGIRHPLNIMRGALPLNHLGAWWRFSPDQFFSQQASGFFLFHFFSFSQLALVLPNSIMGKRYGRISEKKILLTKS